MFYFYPPSLEIHDFLLSNFKALIMLIRLSNSVYDMPLIKTWFKIKSHLEEPLEERIVTVSRWATSWRATRAQLISTRAVRMWVATKTTVLVLGFGLGFWIWGVGLGIRWRKKENFFFFKNLLSFSFYKLKSRSVRRFDFFIRIKM